MTRELILLRYSLLIIPAIFSIQVYEFADYDRFTLHFMLLMLLVTLGAKTSGSLAALTGGMELVLTAWLCYEYGPLMVFPALSAVISYSRRQPKNTALTFFCIHLALLNAALLNAAPAVLVFTNLTFLLGAGLNLLLLRTGRGRADTLFLYDELRKSISSWKKHAQGCSSSPRK